MERGRHEQRLLVAEELVLCGNARMLGREGHGGWVGVCCMMGVSMARWKRTLLPRVGRAEACFANAGRYRIGVEDDRVCLQGDALVPA